MTKQEYKDIYDVVGTAMEVYNTLGRGMSELIYQEALMEKTFYADFMYKDIIIELKSADSICSDHRAQLFNYMRITKMYRGLLLNFGEKKLRAERYLYLPEDDNFILLTQENYMHYITD